MCEPTTENSGTAPCAEHDDVVTQLELDLVARMQRHLVARDLWMTT
ncbi:MAG: hypothetical protein M3487_10190 [Actinomycetota bacterium]|nr:hypothetical protein [Actinomycetota bacterium]